MLRIQTFLWLFVFTWSAQSADLPYSYTRLGNTADIVTVTTAGTVLMGGGYDVDAAFKWMCELSAHGDFLVIRANGNDGYNAYVKALCPNANSVATLIIPSVAAAHDAFVISTIMHAEAIFISGGDQSDYINYWQDTPLQQALNARINSGMPIGGTSAGVNVLAQFVYSAQETRGVTSTQALANPYHQLITFEHDFVQLPFLSGVIVDPHFFMRDRIGRNLSFMCRIYENGWSKTPRGITVDGQTALLIDAHGQAKVVGINDVYFLQANAAPQACTNKVPLTYEDVAVYRIDRDGGSFDLQRWQGSGGNDYSISAINGELSSTQEDASPY
jgi:cyanophycinase